MLEHISRPTLDAGSNLFPTILRNALAINRLHEAAQLAAEIGLPGEQWQIQAALGNVYETEEEQELARTAFEEARRIIQKLAQDIKDASLRSLFLTGPQIQPIIQHAQYLATSIPEN